MQQLEQHFKALKAETKNPLLLTSEGSTLPNKKLLKHIAKVIDKRPELNIKDVVNVVINVFELKHHDLTVSKINTFIRQCLKTV